MTDQLLWLLTQIQQNQKHQIHNTTNLGRNETCEIIQAWSIRLAKFEELSGESTAEALTVVTRKRRTNGTKPSFVILDELHGFKIEFATSCESQHMQIAIFFFLAEKVEFRGLNLSLILICLSKPNWKRRVGERSGIAQFVYWTSGWAYKSRFFMFVSSGLLKWLILIPKTLTGGKIPVKTIH